MLENNLKLGGFIAIMVIGIILKFLIVSCLRKTKNPLKVLCDKIKMCMQLTFMVTINQ